MRLLTTDIDPMTGRPWLSLVLAVVLVAVVLSFWAGVIYGAYTLGSWLLSALPVVRLAVAIGLIGAVLFMVSEQWSELRTRAR